METSPQVAVGHGGRWWLRQPGGRLTVGRHELCDVVLPDDRHVSRHALTLEVLSDCVLVRNVSGSRPLTLRPPAGQDHVIEPGEAITSLPHSAFELVVTGVWGEEYVVRVDASALTPTGTAAVQGARPGPVPSRVGVVVPRTVTDPIRLTPAQRRVLAALCEPLLLRRGPEAVPATYGEIAARLELNAGYVRNVLKSLREELEGQGLSGLTSPRPAAHNDFRHELALLAIRNAWVTVEHVRALDRPSKEDIG